MPYCPYCGASVPEGAIACGKCGATMNAQGGPASTPFQSQPPNSQPPQGSPPWGNKPNYNQPSTRLESALKKTEQLSYVAIGLGAAIIIIFIVLYLLP